MIYIETEMYTVESWSTFSMKGLPFFVQNMDNTLEAFLSTYESNTVCFWDFIDRFI